MIKVDKKKTLLKIQALRKSRGWSQKDLAQKAHMTQGNYSRIENGETELTIDLTNQLAGIFDVDFWDLIASDDQVTFNNHNNTNAEHGYIGSYVVNHNKNNPISTSLESILSGILEEQKKTQIMLDKIIYKLN